MFTSFLAAVAARVEPAVRADEAGLPFELTGAVFANWVYKSTALLEDFGVPDAELVVVCPAGALHWRAAAAALAAAGLGAVVHLLPPSAPAPEAAHVAVSPAGFEHCTAAEAADEVFVFATAPLALSTEIEPGFLDFIAEVRSRPDVVTVPATAQLRLTTAAGAVSAAVPTSADGVTAAVLTGVPTSSAEVETALRALLGGVLELGSAAT